MITSQFTNGLGNRLFTMNKLLSEAKKKKLEPVFVKEICLPNKHCPVNNLFSLFPNIRIVEQQGNVEMLFPPILTIIDTSVVNDKHLISQHIRIPSTELIKDTFFVHFRRGDYENNINYTDLSETNYYERAISYFSSRGHINVLIFSNDIGWCRKNTSHLFEGFNVNYDTSEDEIMSLSKMKACELGGISANSTFGFWGLQLNNGPHKIMPSPFPMKHIWPISTAVSTKLDGFQVIHLNGQNNYSLLIAIVLITLILFSLTMRL